MLIALEGVSRALHHKGGHKAGDSAACSPPTGARLLVFLSVAWFVVTAGLQTDSLGDISTLADPGVVADLIARANAIIAAAQHK